MCYLGTPPLPSDAGLKVGWDSQTSRFIPAIRDIAIKLISFETFYRFRCFHSRVSTFRERVESFQLINHCQGLPLLSRKVELDAACETFLVHEGSPLESQIFSVLAGAWHSTRDCTSESFWYWNSTLNRSVSIDLYKFTTLIAVDYSEFCIELKRLRFTFRVSQ